MKAYIVRRFLYFIPVWLGVYTLTFTLFHLRDPLVLAGSILPQAPLETRQDWVREHNYHLPLVLNLPGDATVVRADGRVHPEFAEQGIFYSQYFLHLGRLLALDFGVDKTRKPILDSFRERIGPTLSIMLPSFVIAGMLSIALALIAAYYRNQPVDIITTIIAVALLSIALPVYILLFNSVFGQWLRVLPIYNHLALPILIAIVATAGGQLRFYRSIFSEQMDAPYIQAGRARGIPEFRLASWHVFRNSMIPILTSFVMSLPFLITGSLLLEQFFGIPGMGDMLYTAIISQDVAVIQAIVYVGAFAYLIASLMTDIGYAFVDPRVKF